MCHSQPASALHHGLWVGSAAAGQGWEGRGVGVCGSQFEFEQHSLQEGWTRFV